MPRDHVQNVLVPSASLKNLLLVLRYEGLHHVNERPTDPVFSILMVSETGRPAWPPSAAVGTPGEWDPPGEFETKAVPELLFVPEPSLARWFKERVTGRAIPSHRIVMRTYFAKEFEFVLPI
jgi:hypothetical protein